MATAALAALLVTTSAPHARAQHDADELFREGVALREAGDTAGAIDRLRRAYRVDPSPRVTYNLAAALAQSGRYVEARFLLRRLLGREEANLLIGDAARQLLDRVATQIATVRVDVADGPLSQRVVVDGTREVEEGRDVSIDPGAHRIEVRAPDGTVLARAEVELAPGQRAQIALRPVLSPSRSDALAHRDDGLADGAIGGPVDPGADDTWLWVGVAAGVTLVVAAVITGTAIALAGQGGAAIDGDLEDVHVGGRR